VSRIRGSLAVILAGALIACSEEASLPPGSTLVRQASEQMARVRSVAFTFDVEGDLGLLLIRRAEGAMNGEGAAAGTVLLEQGQSLIEYQVVISEGTYYLKGPTGGWTIIPEGLASGIPDPTTMLDPESGLAAILGGVETARTEKADDVDGVAAYLVRARLPADPLRSFLPLSPEQEFVDGALWIGRDRRLLLRADVEPPPAPGQRDPPSLSITLRAFNQPVSVTPPA
jgi:lipoprotein LprG